MIGCPTNTNPVRCALIVCSSRGVERVLIDVPGCPLILTTDSPYPRQGDRQLVEFRSTSRSARHLRPRHVEVQPNHSATRCIRIRLDNGLDLRAQPTDGIDDARFADSVVGIDRDANSDSDTDADTDSCRSTYSNHLAGACHGYQRRFPLVGRLGPCIGARVPLSTT